jgi:hypothetical protein
MNSETTIRALATGLSMGATVLLVASPAHSQQNLYEWCVDATGTVSDWSICYPTGTPCSEVHATIADALAAAAATPDYLPGLRPEEHRFCILTPGIHTESVHVENTDGVIGKSLQFRYGSAFALSGCPDEAGDDPMFRIEGNGANELDHLVTVTSLRMDQRACPGSERPLADISSSDFELIDGRLVGGVGPLMTAVQPSSEISVGLQTTRIEGVQGPLYSGDGRFSAVASEISRIDAGASPLINLTGRGARIDLNTTALFANISRGEPLISLASDVYFWTATLAGNVVLGGAPLVAVEVAEHDRTVNIVIDRSVFSRNHLLGDGTASPPAFVSISNTVDQECLPAGADSRPYHDRDLPAWTGTSSPAALIDLFGAQLVPRANVSLQKSFVVANQMAAGGAVFRMGGDVDGLTLSLVHSTFDEPNGRLVDGGGAGSGARFVSARNLYLQEPGIDLGKAWTHIEMSMDEINPDPGPVAEALGDIDGVIGPFPKLAPWEDSPWFRDVATVRGLTNCARNTLVCPEVEFNCSGINWYCALDEAAAYVPTPEFRDGVSFPWPWRGVIDLIDVLENDGEVPGATGWRCNGHDFPWDVHRPASQDNGDGDTYTTLLDCDNDNPLIVPILPEEDGITTPDCRPTEGGCYECPDGTEVTDDDDAIDDDDAVDDDDSAPEDPTPEPAPTPDPGDDDTSLKTGCAVTGCGVPYRCVDGQPVPAWLSLLLAPLGLRRRRWRSDPPLDEL